jgi:hypothetical protein
MYNYYSIFRVLNEVYKGFFFKRQKRHRQNLDLFILAKRIFKKKVRKIDIITKK